MRVEIQSVSALCENSFRIFVLNNVCYFSALLQDSQSFLRWNFDSLETESLLLFLEKKIFLSVGLRIKSSGVVLFA